MWETLCGCWRLCAAGLLAGGLVNAATAAGPEDVYRGKTVNLIVGYSAGGGYDTYARLIARHMSRHIPGKPTIVVQNMPGAGSLKSLEYLLNVAPKDGLTFGTFGRSLPMSPLLEGAKYDATRFEWLGSATSDTSTCLAWVGKGINALADAKTKQFTVGGLAKGSDPDIFSAVVRNAFGLNIKLVTGYPGTKDLVIALERGEIDGICGYTLSSVKTNRSWIDEKKIVFLAQIGLVRDKQLPDVPLSEFATNERQRHALELISLSQTVARPYVMPPGTDKERVAAMRVAFDAVLRDPDLLAEARTADLEINPFTGAEVTEILRKAYATPKDVVAEAVRMIGE